ncbi:MAG: triphosphoribosyl-dephospho-CoA synthase [Synergistaceae bacterium]|jgi:triphosphoribosyl-dephospho-CoA synthetase|nr:triphosphoribosyl-dephospho-CoA synthase [Synergistaceae bacterium]
MTDIPPSCVYFKSPCPVPVAARERARALGAFAALASFEEIAISPKPGLVDPTDSGSHDDMTWVTFIMSASALAPFWSEQAMDGIIHGHYKPSDGLHVKLRARGTAMERKMFEATGGVNTHRGLVYVLSILLGASGMCAEAGDSSPERICAVAASIAAPLAEEDFGRARAKASAGEELTHGERIFIEHGIGGVRHEAASGFPSALSALAELESALGLGASLPDASLSALLLLMLEAEDTNIIHRSGVGFWRGEYRERTLYARKNFDPMRPGGYEPLLDLNGFLTARGASPGGAADLLVCTLFLYRSKILDNINAT